ncbi:Heterokaryon incompatibility protein (HET) domain containing protein [Elaphomyces granulatus]
MMEEVQTLDIDDLTRLRETKRKLARVHHFRELLIEEQKIEQHISKHAFQKNNPVSEEKKADIYDQLDEDDIRLLVLLPTPHVHYPLICRLQKVSLQTEPTYAALSYSWGTDPPQAKLYVQTQDSDPDHDINPDEWGYIATHAVPVAVQNNLFRALLRLRRPDRAVALWVDALSIDQKNSIEKTQQLRKMFNIYQTAENVCIWLGESDDGNNSDSAMEFIPNIMDFAMLDKHAGDSEQAKSWASLAELMRDRLFSRRWVVQEIALAKSATVHCGKEKVHWCDFADAISLLVAKQETIRRLFDNSEWRYGSKTLGEVQSFGANVLLEATSNLFLRTARGGIMKPVKTLEALVTSLKTFDATDARDIIYGLVSIASDTFTTNDTTSSNSANQHAKLDLDYGKSEVDVYKDFTEFCINSSRSLNIICRHWAIRVKDKHGKDTELPSWIPLLSNSEFGAPHEVYGGRKNGDSLVGPAGRPHYRACGDSKAIRPFENGLTNDNSSETRAARPLLAKGFKLASIGRLSPRNTAGLVLRESLEMGGWTGIVNNNSSVPDKIWRTLIADRDFDGQVPPTWYQRVCLRCLDIANAFNNGDLNIGQLLKEHSEILHPYLKRVRNVTWNRKFFIATIDSAMPEDPSELFGLCPPTTKENDLIFVLYGCSVPVILREISKEGDDRGPYYQLIGEAYVHGKMDGEAMDLENGRANELKLL